MASAVVQPADRPDIRADAPRRGFVLAEEGGRILGNQMVDVARGRPPEGKRPEVENPGAYLLAWDPVARKPAWEQREGSGSAGTLLRPVPGVPGHQREEVRGVPRRHRREGVGDRHPGQRRAGTGDVLARRRPVHRGDPSASTGFAAAAGKNRLLVYTLNGAVQLPPAPPPIQQVLNPPPDSVMRQCTRAARTSTSATAPAATRVGDVQRLPDLNYTVALNSPDLFNGIVEGALAETA